jgi:hypothetical protein
VVLVGPQGHIDETITAVLLLLKWRRRERGGEKGAEK